MKKSYYNINHRNPGCSILEYLLCMLFIINIKLYKITEIIWFHQHLPKSLFDISITFQNKSIAWLFNNLQVDGITSEFCIYLSQLSILDTTLQALSISHLIKNIRANNIRVGAGDLFKQSNCVKKYLCDWIKVFH